MRNVGSNFNGNDYIRARFTLLALTNMANSQKIKEAIATVWKTYQINPIVEILNIDDQGVSVN